MAYKKNSLHEAVLIKTPLRLEFLGGSTDMASFYTQSTGRVLNVAIDRYIYILVKRIAEPKVRFIHEDISEVPFAENLSHTRARAALKEYGIKKHVEIVSLSDLKGGSGLGSSSSFSVGIISALSQLMGKKNLSPRELAEAAARLEIEILKEPIGKQDQYGAAFGGINYLVFKKDGYVERKEILLTKNTEKRFYNHFLVFNTGKGHSASEILSAQKKRNDNNLTYLKEMAATVPPAIKALQKGDLQRFAEILELEWTIKKNLGPGITNTHLESMYAQVKKAGAWGGRVSGAGGGGYMFFLAPPSRHQAIRKALQGFKEEQFRFTRKGSTVLSVS